LRVDGMIASPMKVQKVTEIDVPGLGQQIKQARESDGRKLTRICAEVGMTTANWYKIEGEDTKALPLETLRRIEEVLGVNFGVEL
jgi:transcriptional regulator with XRE-family HTH domain